MKLYNTLSKKVEEFKSLQEINSGSLVSRENPKQVNMYACGVTVYDYTHIGHLRKYVMDDILVRVLRHAGYDVKHIQNITDVGHLVSDDDEGEDKMEKGARKYGQSAFDVAKKFEEYFFYSMDLMGVLRPTLSCRATEHIQSQLDMVLDLEKKGYTYVIDGDGVYFDTSKLETYGELSGHDPRNAPRETRMGENASKKIQAILPCGNLKKLVKIVK
jgi:cysteinyl-tRNA synthetase